MADFSWLPQKDIKPRNTLLDLAQMSQGLDTIQNANRYNDQMAMKNDQIAYDRGRDAKADQLKQVETWGKWAGALDKVGKTNPELVAKAWPSILNRHPNKDSLGPEYHDPTTGPALVAAEAGQYFDPRESQMVDLNLQEARNKLDMAPLDRQYKQAQIESLRQRGDGGYGQRAAAAQAYGIDPNSDQGRAFILTGNMPREDQQSLTAVDKKAILEADEMVGTNRAAISAIDQALALSDKANAGWMSGVRASIGANLPDGLVPDSISSPESSRATIDFDNAVVGQALTQLKAIFGGNPTEGERKILLDLQGSSNMPREVRKQILGRAKDMAVNRLRLNEQRASQLRGGSFYRPGGGSAAGNPMTYSSSSGDPLAEARDAIARGASRDAVMQRLQQNGIDTSGL